MMVSTNSRAWRRLSPSATDSGNSSDVGDPAGDPLAVPAIR
jgi:hypothetical protein